MTEEKWNRHVTISEYAWGGRPLDYEWCINSAHYKETEQKLITKNIIKP